MLLTGSLLYQRLNWPFYSSSTSISAKMSVLVGRFRMLDSVLLDQLRSETCVLFFWIRRHCQGRSIGLPSRRQYLACCGVANSLGVPATTAKLLLNSSIAFTLDRKGMKVNINAAKTDFFRQGCVIRIGCRCSNADKMRICPTHEMENYLGRHRSLPNEPLFQINGKILNRKMVATMITTVKLKWVFVFWWHPCWVFS